MLIWLAECLHAACMMLRVASWCCLLITCMLCDSGCVHNRLHPTSHAVARHMHGACNSLLGCIIQYVRQGSPSCCVVRVVVSSDICSLLQRRMSHTCSRATGVCVVRMCMAGLIHAACISISKQRSSCRVLAANSQSTQTHSACSVTRLFSHILPMCPAAAVLLQAQQVYEEQQQQQKAASEAAR